jgi:hypothetical protein
VRKKDSETSYNMGVVHYYMPGNDPRNVSMRDAGLAALTRGLVVGVGLGAVASNIWKSSMRKKFSKVTGLKIWPEAAIAREDRQLYEMSVLPGLLLLEVLGPENTLHPHISRRLFLVGKSEAEARATIVLQSQAADLKRIITLVEAESRFLFKNTTLLLLISTDTDMIWELL